MTEMQPALAASLGRLIARRAAAGGQYLVWRDDQLAFELCHGMADSGAGIPVTTQTTFNLYSITKAATAAAIARGIALGKLDPTAAMAEAANLPSLRAFGTVAETIAHRAGFPNPWPLRWTHLEREHSNFDTSAFARKMLTSLAPVRSSRRRFRYSNLGYLALGEALAVAKGETAAHAIEQLVLAQLPAMAGAMLDFALRPEHHACPHIAKRSWLAWLLPFLLDRKRFVRDQDSAWIRLHCHYVNGLAYGGLFGNARGVATLGRYLLRQALLSQTTPKKARALSAFPGLFAGSSSGIPWYSHAGGGLGYYGELRLYPSLAAVSVFLSNGSGFRDSHCLSDLDQHWLPA